MKKLSIFIALVALTALVWLSYIVFGLSQSQEQLQQQLHQAQKNSANLNDRLVALQRTPVMPTATVATVTEAKPVIHPLIVIQQQLDLIEFALQQQQYGYALEKLDHLDAQLADYEIAETLQQSLAQALNKDRQVIQTFVNERQVQQQKVNQLLQQLDQTLTLEIQQQNLTVEVDSEEVFWKKWFKLEPANRPATQLMQRQFVLKEVQLHLLLARQLLLQGQYLAYQQEMSTVIQILQTLPDQKAQQLLKQLEELKGLSMLATPNLTTRALLR